MDTPQSAENSETRRQANVPVRRFDGTDVSFAPQRVDLLREPGHLVGTNRPVQSHEEEE